MKNGREKSEREKEREKFEKSKNRSEAEFSWKGNDAIALA